MEQFIPELWSKKLEEMLLGTKAYVCTNQNYDGEIKYQNDILTLPNNKKLDVSEKKFFAFKINDVAQVQSNTDIMEAHLKNAKKAIEEAQDAYLLSQHRCVEPANIIGSEDEPIILNKSTIYSEFTKLALCLKKHTGKAGYKRLWVIINPIIESYLLQAPEFISAQNIAEKTLRNGAIGRFAGIDVLVSPNLSKVDGKYYVLAGTNDAITFASQLAKIESLRDKDSFSDLVRGLYLYGAETVQPKALAKMIVKND